MRSISAQTTSHVKKRGEKARQKLIQDIGKAAAEAERVLREMGIDADVMLLDEAACTGEDASGVEIIKLTDLPELLADPIGFAQRRFGRTSADVIPFNTAVDRERS
jgi:hypothetical protein